MKDLLIKYIKLFCSLFPLRKVILFESVPDMEGNSRAVFDAMIKLGLNEKYKMVWLVDNKKKINKPEINNVYFNAKPVSLYEKIQYILKYFNVKVKITENACYPKFHHRTMALHLGHGTAIKNTGSLMHINGSADYALYQSEAVKEVAAELHNLDEDQLVCLGYPRNDNLIKGSRAITDENYIVWLPTFRKSSLSNRVDSDYDFPLGIPIFKDFSEVKRLNSILKKNHFKLYIKPHFVADLKAWDVGAFSHVRLITEDYYKNQNLLFYEFLGMSKALITDYSSVYFDYLLVDRPIGITVDDLQQYEQGIGFVYEDFKETILGEYIDDYEDLEQYIVNCIEEKLDIHYLRERKEKFNEFIDDESSIRVVKFLEEQADL